MLLKAIKIMMSKETQACSMKKRKSLKLISLHNYGNSKLFNYDITLVQKAVFPRKFLSTFVKKFQLESNSTQILTLKLTLIEP